MKKTFVGILRHPGYNGDFADDVLGFDPNGGGIYDIPVIGDVADVVVNSFVGNIIAYAFPPAAPFIYAAKTAQSLASGNEFGALLNAVGAYTAYASPTATTTGSLAGMEVSGINANLVAGVEMASAGGASVTDIAKVMAGMGDQTKVAEILKNAGYPEADVVAAVNAAGEAASTYTPTLQDAQDSLAAMKDYGLDPEIISAQMQNYADAGVINQTQLNTFAATGNIQAPITDLSTPVDPSYGAPAPITDLSTPVQSSNPYAGTYDGSGGLTGFEGDPTQINNVVRVDNLGVGYDAAGNPVGWVDDTSGVWTNYSDYQVPTSSVTQAQKLAEQYKGFSQADIVEHMAGSAIDPVMAEEILGTLGMDPFAVSDYMTANPNSFGNTYSDPSFLSKLKKFGENAKTLKSLWDGGQGTGGAGASGSQPRNFGSLMSQVDPYWGYRKETEIPMMGAAAGAAGQLSGMYQQSFADPLSVYNRPEMQATNAAFMNEMQRRDAAAGRMSQYGSRGVEAQNNFLSKTLPAYQTNIQQGLGTLYQAARPQAIDQGTSYQAAKDATLAAMQPNAARGAGGIQGSVSNLQGSWNQMTGGDNFFDQATGAIDTAANLSDLYTKGSDAWKTIGKWF